MASSLTLPRLGFVATLVASALSPGCSCGATHSRDDAGPTLDAIALVDASVVSGDAPCVGPGCTGECPSGIDPWNPENPANACSPEGATCMSGGGGACSFFQRCECTEGTWTCLVAEPDPACWCGREPTVGSECNEEGATCGACCPTPEDPDPFGPFACIDGRWAAGDCPAIECPSIDPPSCPAVRELGTTCANEGQICGDVCCSSQQCVGGVWVPGPDADCLCDPTRSFACGSGSCTERNACTAHCGPDDGLEHRCDPLPADCTSCDCVPLAPGETCEERDGRVFVRENTLCG